MLADLAAILVVHHQMVVPDLSLFHTWLCPVRYLKEYSMDCEIQIDQLFIRYDIFCMSYDWKNYYEETERPKATKRKAEDANNEIAKRNELK